MQALRDWYNAPFDDTMNAFDWAVFVGFLIVVSIFWGIVLRHLRVD